MQRILSETLSLKIRLKLLETIGSSIVSSYNIFNVYYAIEHRLSWLLKLSWKLINVFFFCIKSFLIVLVRYSGPILMNICSRAQIGHIDEQFLWGTLVEFIHDSWFFVA